MKSKDIVIGERYAVGHKDYPREAIVLEKGVRRRVFSGERCDWGGHDSDRADGIRVLYVGNNDDKGIEPASRFHWTWDEQVVRVRECRAREEKDAKCDERIARLADRLTAAGIKARQSYLIDSYTGANVGRYLLEIENVDVVKALLNIAGERFTWMDGDVQIKKPVGAKDAVESFAAHPAVGDPLTD